MLYAAFRSNLYNSLLVLHIALAIVGFGSVLLNGVYGAQAKKRGGREGLAITEANFFVSTRIAEIAIYLVPLVGFALVGVSDGVWGFDETWVWLSIVLYVVALGITHSMIVPSAKRLIALQHELVEGPPPQGPPAQAAEMAQCGKRLGMASSVNTVILLVIVTLMVFKFGGTNL